MGSRVGDAGRTHGHLREDRVPEKHCGRKRKRPVGPAEEPRGHRLFGTAASKVRCCANTEVSAQEVQDHQNRKPAERQLQELQRWVWELVEARGELGGLAELIRRRGLQPREEDGAVGRVEWAEVVTWVLRELGLAPGDVQTLRVQGLDFFWLLRLHWRLCQRGWWLAGVRGPEAKRQKR